MKMRVSKAWIAVLFAVFLLVGFIIAIFTAPRSSQNLRLKLQLDDNAFLQIPAESLDGKYEEDIILDGVGDVKIQLGLRTFPLDDAIRSGRISVEEMIALAQLDVRAGLCDERQFTRHGVTELVYRYKEYELHYIHDVLAAPDGREHMLNFFGIYPRNSTMSHYFVDEDAEISYMLDREDWGLEFEILEVSPTGVRMQYSQFGGQHFGDLSIILFGLYHRDFSHVPEINKLAYEIQIPIKQDATEEINIGWKEAYDVLPAGEYYFKVTVFDTYDQQSVHPLAENFYDMQSYYIPFVLQ